MKLALKYIKKIAVIACFVSFVFIAKKARDYAFCIDGCSCNFDNIIACSHKSKIFNFINLDQELKTYSLDKISQKIREKFCVIKDLEIYQAASGILSLNIYSLEPKFILNGSYVLTESKAVFEKDLFCKSALKSCKPVNLVNCGLAGLDLAAQDNINCETTSQDLQEIVTDSCKNMIFSIPSKYFQEYEITRESDCKSYMLDKTNKNFIILFNDLIVPDDRLLAYCLYIKNDLHERGEFNKKVPKNWIADIRFEDQIVVGN